MKKKMKIIALVISIGLFSMAFKDAYAEDFSSNEAYYQNLCSSYNTDPNVSATCSAFRSYLSTKAQNLRDQVASMNNDIASIKANLAQLQETINQQQETIDMFTNMIAENDASISRIQESIVLLDVEMERTQRDIDKRDLQIKERMRSEQAAIGTNVYVEFVMGAKDLVDLVRIANGIERITENDQDEIAALQEDKNKLEQQKNEQQRLKQEQEDAKLDNIKNKEAQEVLQNTNLELQVAYQQQEADLIAQMRSAESAAKAVNSQIIAIDNVQYEASDGWIRPVQAGYVSAGTFFYPGGGFHAGEDFAASVGTPIYAPIGGIVVYANNPAPTNGGYLGNWIGYPSGGGNTVHMVGSVNGVTYGISFFHMAQENFVAYPGMSLSQGSVIGRVGHSGNSTGPHCHVEVINLGSMSVSDAIARFRSSGADFAWGTGWNTTATSCESTGYSTPCREHPEKFFGK